MSEIFKIGIPILVFQILTSLSISLTNNAAADYGDAAITGMGVVARFEKRSTEVIESVPKDYIVEIWGDTEK